MGNTLKLISGIILFICGIVLVYVTYANHLLDILLFAGFIITIIGIILIIGHFVDSSADKTRSLISDIVNSSSSTVQGLNLGESRSEGFLNPFKSNKFSYDDSKGPLRVRNDYLDDESEPIVLRELDYADFDRTYEEDSYLERANRMQTPVETDKSVLNIVPEEKEVNFDNKLNFTPNYDRPLKITRKPKRREEEFFDDKYIYYGEVEDRTEDISKALYEDNDVIIPQHNIPVTEPLASEPEREIKIDINNPESLPVPKLLKSFVVCKGGIVTSQEAFELLVANIQKEVMLEIPTLIGLSEQFISNIPSIYSRVIIEEFNLSDLSSLLLISSLLKQGVHVRTIPKVNTINLITDDSYALIISESSDISDIEYGAIYTDRDSISDIRVSFDTIWEMANELDENTILQEINGGY